MANIDLTTIKGSVPFDDYIDDILLSSKMDKLGELWEKVVKCDRCKFKQTCHDLAEKVYDEKGINITCNQVIDILYGDLDIDDIKPEEN